MTHREFFDAIRDLGPLRVISPSGPSLFEAICRLERYAFADGHMNAFTDAYHWHVELARFRHLTTRDATHTRSGRRVLFFELRETSDAEPFLLVYLHRAKGEEFDRLRAAQFAELHEKMAAGCEVAS